ncbi:MAG: efflux RND transporter periplasmic adaptor subunit [Myxococcota bacterium]|nr:efflux RND transporter periplasmic adaptor subunit [Myxococcota bacterium]
MTSRLRLMTSSSTMPRAVIALLATVAISWLGCESSETSAPDVSEAPRVVVESVRLLDVIDQVEATGQLVAEAEAVVASQVSGQVTAILVEEGEAVEAGQVLLEIDPERRELEMADAEAHLEEARALVADAHREVRRIKGLHDRAAASQAKLEDAQTQKTLALSRETGAEARVGLARRALRDATIRAPFAGRVARRHANVGEFLSTGIPLFKLVALDPIEVEFAVSEVDSSRIAIGNQVQIQVAPYPDESFLATVTVVSPTIDSSTRTLRVKAELPNADLRLRPGLFAHVNVGVDEREGVVMVSESAILQRAGGSIIYRVVADRVERLPVESGIQVGEWVEIKGGVLSPGDQVVVRGQVDLVDGLLVVIRTRDGQPVPGSAQPIPQVAAPGPVTELAPGAGL